MAMGKKKRQQESMWLATGELPKSPGHPFYQRLNVVLEEAGLAQYRSAFAEPRRRR
jgi:hypothetical protein